MSQTEQTRDKIAWDARLGFLYFNALLVLVQLVCVLAKRETDSSLELMQYE